MARQRYDADLSDARRLKIKMLFSKRRERPGNQDFRKITGAIFELLRAGRAWRLLPHDLPSGFHRRLYLNLIFQTFPLRISLRDDE